MIFKTNFELFINEDIEKMPKKRVVWPKKNQIVVL